MKGALYIVSAPSGAGKTSLVKALLESTPSLAVSVSYTTRPMRQGEQDGVHYHFVDHDTFSDMIEKRDFLEYAEVFDHYYGTSRTAVMDHIGQGIDVVLEIDWQGARQVRESMPQSVGIFVLPPSRAVLEQRLRARKQDCDKVIARRMRDAVNEISHYAEFDYLVVNDDFGTACEDMRAIVRSRRLTRAVQSARLRMLLTQLLG